MKSASGRSSHPRSFLQWNHAMTGEHARLRLNSKIMKAIFFGNYYILSLELTTSGSSAIVVWFNAK